MKKVICKIALIIFGVSIFIKPASAGLIIDPTQIAGVVSKYAQKIGETTQKIQELIQQVNVMSTQGFNLDALRDLANEYYKKNGGVLSQKFNEVVGGTREKKKIERQEDAESYKTGSIKLYQAKKDVAEKNKSELEKLASETRAKITEREIECNRLEAEYNSKEAQEVGSGSSLLVELAECKSDVETLKSNTEDIAAQIVETKKIIKNEEAKIKKFENEEDDVEKANKDRIKKLEKDEDESSTIVEPNDEGAQKSKEWDDEDALNSYELDGEEYRTFIENYFYDPASLASKGGLEYENKVNKVMRNRKFLFVNTAAHLLQVTATTRRELPLRIESSDAMFEKTIKSEGGEIGNIAAYSNVRIENAKTLFLYARLLSAKIQYLAARDLLKSELRKEITDESGDTKSFGGIDLEKYILTDEYVNKMQEKANKTLDEMKEPETKMIWSE